MATLTLPKYTVEYQSAGSPDRPAVFLLHSAASSLRQWKALMELLEPDFFVMAPNLFGYGDTSTWPSSRSLAAAAEMLLETATALGAGEQLAVVGHSYGGAVAFKVAECLGTRLTALVQFEPIPFHLLRDAGAAAWSEAEMLGNVVRDHGGSGDWEAMAIYFTDYWLGKGSWTQMPVRHRDTLLAAMPPLLDEIPAVLNEKTPLQTWSAGWSAPTLIMNALNPRPTIAALADLFATACPAWRFATVLEGGHMAPLVRPELVNPIIASFLRETLTLV